MYTKNDIGTTITDKNMNKVKIVKELEEYESAGCDGCFYEYIDCKPVRSVKKGKIGCSEGCFIFVKCVS